jgi:hypothetical protein
MACLLFVFACLDTTYEIPVYRRSYYFGKSKKKKKKKRNGKRSFLMVFPQRLEVNEEKGRKEGRKNQKAA